MENNVYKILQEWNELLKDGVISESDFVSKKRELLALEENIENNGHTREVIYAPSAKEKAQGNSEYEINYGDKPWFEKNKSWLIAFITIVFVCLVLYLINNNSSKGSYDNNSTNSINSDTKMLDSSKIDNSTNNSSKEHNDKETTITPTTSTLDNATTLTNLIDDSVGTYIVNASKNNKVYYHNFPTESSIRVKAYFDSHEDVDVIKVESGYGYVEKKYSNGKSTIGWLDMKYLIRKPT